MDLLYRIFLEPFVQMGTAPDLLVQDWGVTAADLDRFLRALQAGRLFSASLRDSMLKPHVFHGAGKTERRFFSYVLEFSLDAADRVVFYQKDGVNRGVSAIMRYYPDRDINVVLLANMEDGVWQPVKHIHGQVQSGAWG